MDNVKIKEILPSATRNVDTTDVEELRNIADRAISTHLVDTGKLRIRSGEQFAVAVGRTALESINTTGNTTSTGQLVESDRKTSGTDSSTFRLGEGNIIKPWRNVGNFNGKILDIYDDVVLVECLVDRENKQYAEMEFPKSLFSTYDVAPGKFCVINKYERENSMLLEVNANPKLDLSQDFPGIDWVGQFRTSSIFKSK